MVVESNDELYSPRFSPRGDSIAFFSKSAADSISLGVVDLSGKGKKILSEWIDAQGAPCWSPDGREIWVAGAAEPGQTSALYSVDPTGKRRLVTRVPGSLDLDDISRDGRVLLAHHTILQIVTGLVPGGEKERNLAWLDGSIPADLSPDGKVLVFTEIAEGSGPTPAVYLRKTDGSPAVRLGDGSAIALSPDGEWVLASVRRGGGKPERLVLLPTGAGESRTLNDRLENFGGGAWLPDGKSLVFSAQEKGHEPRIHVQDWKRGDARSITPEGVWIRRAINPLSPDGKLVLGFRSTANPSLYPLDGGEARPIVGLETQDRPIQWSEDGRSLYVHKVFGIPNRIWRLDLTSGKKESWLEIKPGEPINVFFLLMTRDGKTFVYGGQRASSELYLVEGLR